MKDQILICENCKKFLVAVTKCECGSTSLCKTADSNVNHIEWVCTDPDNNQFGRRIGESKYEFKEGNAEEGWVQEVIDLQDYDKEKKDGLVKSYYSSMDEVISTYGSDTDWIVAEIIFEQEYAGY